jgi:predicted nucleotidyltransferase
MDWPSWTPYDDVNEILQQLLTGARAILGDNFVGLYLDGSLASGDFDYETSDIDFVVATANPKWLRAVPITPPQMDELVQLHGRIGKTHSKWALEIEGAYIPLDALRRYDPTYATHPYIDRGDCRLRWEHLEMDWVIHRHVLHTGGITLAGPPIQTLVDPVSPEELRQAVIGLFNFWWQPMSQEPASLTEEGYRRYAILTMCRMLYTLAHGVVVSKPAAAQWALHHLEPRWQSLIEWARVWPTAVPTNNLHETQQFIEATTTFVADASAGSPIIIPT